MKKTGGHLPRFQNTGEVIIPSGFGGIDDGNNETYPTRADIQEFHALNADNYRTEALYNQGKVLTDQANELVEHEVDIWSPPLGTIETIIDVWYLLDLQGFVGPGLFQMANVFTEGS